MEISDFSNNFDVLLNSYAASANFGSTDNVSLYVNDTLIETVHPSDYIAQFTAYTFTEGDEIKVSCGTVEDSFII